MATAIRVRTHRPGALRQRPTTRLYVEELEQRALPATGTTGSGLPFSNMQPSLALNYIMAEQGIFPTREGGHLEGGRENAYVGEIKLFAGNFAPAGWHFCAGQLLPIAGHTALFSILGTMYGGDGRTNFALPELRGKVPHGFGQGPGLTERNLGVTVGSNDTRLTVSQLPAHAHGLSNDTTGSTGAGQPFSNLQSSLGLNFGVASIGSFEYVGEVLMYAGNFVPSGGHLADGSLLPITENEVLFQQIGTTYGGDGQATFAAPDLRGRVALGAGQGTLGEMAGSESVTLSAAQLPAHTHTLSSSPGVTGSTGGGQPFDNVQPYLVQNYIICIQGFFPSAIGGASSPFLAEIRAMASNSVPRGWAPAQGQLLPIGQNQALFALLGTTYGGDGRVTFALPDLRGRVPIGADPALGNLGQAPGAETLALSVAQLAPHRHTTPWQRELVGAFDDGTFTLAHGDLSFSFGASSDTPLSGDWNDDGETDIGVWRPSTATFYLDSNANGRYDAGTDSRFAFGISSDLPVTGDWNGDGRTDVGIWRPSQARFYLDTTGNRLYDPGVDATFVFGISSDLPVTGDWNGDGSTDIGIWRASQARFYLDSNGNRLYESGQDAVFTFGSSTDHPVSGDWNGDARTDVGVWRPGTATYYLDSNGNRQNDAGSDRSFVFGASSARPLTGDWNGDGRSDVGTVSAAQFALDADADQRLENVASFAFRSFQSGDLPLVGDWDGNGLDDIGIWRGGVFYLDLDGDRTYTAGADGAHAFGLSSDVPVTGDWNGDGITDIGIWRPSQARFYLDTTANRSYDPGVDAQVTFGLTTDLPVTGDWNGDGITDVGIWRPSQARFYLDTSGNRRYDSGIDVQFTYGATGDAPVTGDWDGDGATDVGVWRASTTTFLLDSNASRSLDATDLRVLFGAATSKPLSGRWYNLP